MNAELIAPVVEKDVVITMTEKEARALHALCFFTMTVPNAIEKEADMASASSASAIMMKINKALTEIGL